MGWELQRKRWQPSIILLDKFTKDFAECDFVMQMKCCASHCGWLGYFLASLVIISSELLIRPESHMADSCCCYGKLCDVRSLLCAHLYLVKWKRGAQTNQTVTFRITLIPVQWWLQSSLGTCRFSFTARMDETQRQYRTFACFCQWRLLRHMEQHYRCPANPGGTNGRFIALLLFHVKYITND